MVAFLNIRLKRIGFSFNDDNTKFFHQSIRARKNENKVYAIQDRQGSGFVMLNMLMMLSLPSIKSCILGDKMDARCSVKPQIIDQGVVLTDENKIFLPVTSQLRR